MNINTIHKEIKITYNLFNVLQPKKGLED